MVNGELVATLIIATATVVLGYLLNGWRDRDLERRRTNYRTKLDNFEEANRTLARLFNVLIYTQDLFQKDPQSTDHAVMLRTMMTHAALARDEESVLTSNVAQRALDDLKAVSTLEEDAQEQDLRIWIEANYPGLTTLYVRLLNHHVHHLQSTVWNVQLVAESGSVINAASGLIGAVISALREAFETQTSDTKSRLKRLKPLEQELADLNVSFQRAMRHELESTLPPSRFRKSRQDRDLRPTRRP